MLIPQLQFLQKEGYDVYVVCSEGKWINEIEKAGIKVKTIKIKRNITPFYDLITLFKLWNYFRKEKFNIVHTHTPKPGLLGQLAAKMAGVPIVINTIHGLYFHSQSSFAKKRFFILMEKVAAKCSDLILSQNKEDMSTLVKEKISKSEKIKYLGNGVDITKFDSEKFSENFVSEKKKELNIPFDFNVIGIVARLVEEKGYLDLFEAIKIVLKVFPKTILLVTGAKDSEKKDVINPEVVKNYGIERNVIFLGERSDVDEIYPLMDIFVLPSYREGFPRSVLEAMAEKRPVIASNIRGCQEEIDTGENGVLIPVKNSKKLAETIIFLINNPSRAKVFGENAREKVKKYFNEDLVFGRIKEEYQRLIKEKIK